MKNIVNYFDNQQIDYVFTDQIYSLEEHAAIVAASHSKNTRSVYFHHGADAFDAKSRYFKIVRFFDYYFTVTKEEAEHERSIKKKYGAASPILHL